MSTPALIDTHCHLNFHSYDDDRAEVLRRAREAGVQRIIVPAIDLESCGQALGLAETYEGFYFSVGVHPNSCSTFNHDYIAQLHDLARHERAIAIGEIGLDYYRDKCPQPMQRRALEMQLELAARLELPVIIHNREAGDDVLSALEAWAPSIPSSMNQRVGVLHSFSASVEVAQRAVELGFYLGFTGPITYKNADDLRQIAASVPRDRLLIETDGPFLSPQQQRGKRNEPGFVRFVNEKLAELHGISTDAMAAQTTANAERLFALS